MSLCLGQLVLTRGIGDAVKNYDGFLIELSDSIKRYIGGDWGEIPKQDKKTNDSAVIDGERVVGGYCTSFGKIYIITEATRDYTTILFAEEY